MLTAQLAIVAMLCLIANAQAQNVVSTVREREDKLQCGNVEVQSKSLCLVFPGFETHCRKQTLRYSVPGKSISRVLPHDGKQIRHPAVADGTVIDAMVTGWACIQSAKNVPYIALAYTCMNNERADCSGASKEWTKLFNMDGKPLMNGFPKHGVRVDKLYRQLDLSHYLQKPPELHNVEY